MLSCMVRRLALVLLVLLAARPGLCVQAPVSAVAGVAIPVSDLDAAVAFYTGVLDFTLLETAEADGPEAERLLGLFGLRVRLARLALGAERILLVDFLAPDTGRPYPPTFTSNDQYFQHIAIIVSDMDAAYARLRSRKVRHASSGPQTLPAWNPSAGGIRAFYFKDPDGNVLEILSFPPGKGDPRWQAPKPPAGRLFLGIDHTAIVVRDTAASLAFYRDALGLEVAGESENHGPEQERLNNVFGARLRITALRAATGPGIEFLEYLAPGMDDPFPADTRANDLWRWHILLDTADPAAAAQAARRAGGGFVSPGVVRLPEPLPGLRSGMVIRDPDGHALLLRTMEN